MEENYLRKQSLCVKILPLKIHKTIFIRAGRLAINHNLQNDNIITSEREAIAWRYHWFA